jgi:hypothetical protein
VISYQLHPPTEEGTSSRIKWLDCPRQAYFDSLRRKAWDASGNSEDFEYDHDEDDKLDIGTLFHAGAELYHSGTWSGEGVFSECVRILGKDSRPSVWLDGAEISEGVLSEASRLLAFYVNETPRDHFGHLVGTEILLGGEAQPDVMREVTGSYDLKWTGRVDALFSTEAHARGSCVVVDHKTAASTDKLASIKYKNDMKMRAYMIAARVVGYDVKQACMNIVVKTKVPKIERILIDFPTRGQIAELHSFFAHTEKIKRERYFECNTNRCFDWHRACRYLANAQCNRRNET